MEVYLVRHADVQPIRGVPAPRWPLTGRGRAQADALAATLAHVGRVVASPEPKAVLTAEPIARLAGVPLELDARLREVEREVPVLDSDAFRTLVGDYLEGQTHPGWEERARARARVAAAVAGAAAGHGPVAVVSHGTVLALLLGLGRDGWDAIRMPDVAVWEEPAARIVRGFGSWQV